MASVPVHIVLPTPAIGGAEKRFLGLFLHAARQGLPVRLVASRALVDLAASTDEFADLDRLADRIRTFEVGRGQGTLRRVLVSAWARAARSVFHYVLVPPPLVQLFPSRRTVFTVPLSGLNLYSRVGRATVYAGAAFAGRTDFLDVRVRDEVARKLPMLASRFTVTPGSFVDTNFYAPLAFAEKRDEVVFLGLLSHEKQAFRLVDALPEVAERLRAAGVPVPAFRLYGREAGGAERLADRVSELPRSLDVEVRFEPNPRAALARAKVFLSLQRNTNYPSKSVLEAMACGALPVITDVGDSRRVAPDEVAEWIPRDFAARDLADAIARILTLPPAAFEGKVRAAREFLRARFSVDAMAEYYRALWEAAATGRSAPLQNWK